MIYVDHIICYSIFYGQNIKFSSFTSNGVPFVSVASGASCNIGKGFKMNNGISHNPIGPSENCVIFVNTNATLRIGKEVGISQTAIVCHQSITIGSFVKIGGGVSIYDTDFHSINPYFRRDPKMDSINKVSLPVIIKDNVFIGAYSTILKGVTIGENSIIGACSVVTRDVPDNEIWAGNPAKRIKSLNMFEAKTS